MAPQAATGAAASDRRDGAGRPWPASTACRSASLRPPAVAQGIPLVRDAETENLLKDYSRPIFKAAGLGSHITLRIVKHESFNAFVIDGLNVFINTGTLLQAKTPNEVIGVIAHETGHITGGHLAALRTRIARDQTKALLLMVLGIGAMVGGASAGGDTARELGGLGIGHGAGRAGAALALAAERAALAGVRGRSGRHEVPGGHETIRPRHARNLRELRPAGIRLRRPPGPVCAQPPRGGRSHRPVARAGGQEPLCQREGPARAAVQA